MCNKQHTYVATLSLAPGLLQSLLGIHSFLPVFHAKHHVEILLRISIQNVPSPFERFSSFYYLLDLQKPVWTPQNTVSHHQLSLTFLESSQQSLKLF